jgi:hypothetical protein
MLIKSPLTLGIFHSEENMKEKFRLTIYECNGGFVILEGDPYARRDIHDWHAAHNIAGVQTIIEALWVQRGELQKEIDAKLRGE